MFIGHAAVALAAKTKVPAVPLGWLVAATYGLDLLWPFFSLAGIERFAIDPGATAFTPLAFEHYPWSHSLVMSLVWGAVAAALASAFGKPRGAALLVGAVVVSHWFLDLVTHQPDLPLWPGPSPELGLGLWNSIPGTLLIEGAAFSLAVGMYLRATSARDKIGSVGLWILLGTLVAIWASGPWAPLPPSVQAVSVSALAVWLFVFWAGWVDQHRGSRTSGRSDAIL